MSLDAKSTRDRIRDAARTEFAAVGLSGARVDAIAKRAGCNKQLIYHYFGDKAGLYEAVITATMSERPPVQIASLEDLSEGLDRIWDHHKKRREWIRLLQWESLESQAGALAAEDQRRAHLNRACADIEKAQLSGWLAPGVEPRICMVAIMAMLIFPFAFPQVVRLLTGLGPDDGAFKRQYLSVVRSLLFRGAPPPPPKGASG